MTIRVALLFFLSLFFPLAAGAEFTRDLYFGLMNDPDVITLQEFLRSEGYFTYPASTGNYLTVTLEAVQKFQQANNLEPVGGYFGFDSRTKANSILSRQAPAPKPSMPAVSGSAAASGQPFARDLYFGLRNDPDVVRLQEFLRAQGYFAYPESTGNYFSATVEAVRKFQAANNISPQSGYFGPLTRGKVNQVPASGPSIPTEMAAPQDGPSPFQGKIEISYVSGISENPLFESITLQNRTSGENISITGFIIESDKARFVIPQGYRLPGFEALAQDPVLLRPNERAIITVGQQKGAFDFRENLCTGYFQETRQFTPSLSHRCPRPDTQNLLRFSDACLQVISSAPTCRQADFSKIFESECSLWVNAHLNYAGCVNDYRSREDFFSDQWLLWMQRKEEFFRNVHDKIMLWDREGRRVDEYTY